MRLVQIRTVKRNTAKIHVTAFMISITVGSQNSVNRVEFEGAEFEDGCTLGGSLFKPTTGRGELLPCEVPFRLTADLLHEGVDFIR